MSSLDGPACHVHSTVSSDMNLAPNIGSDRSWVWNVSADVSDGEPTQETLAIRFANAESTSELTFTTRRVPCRAATLTRQHAHLSSHILVGCSTDAGLFKAAFEKARDDNSSSAPASTPAAEPTAAATDDKKDADEPLVAATKEEATIPA